MWQDLCPTFTHLRPLPTIQLAESRGRLTWSPVISLHLSILCIIPLVKVEGKGSEQTLS